MTTSYKDMKNLIREKIKAPRLEKREDILKEYSQQIIKDGKTRLCRFFLQGNCIFTPQQCHFAHDVITDLAFDAPPLEEFLEKLKTYKIENKDVNKIIDEYVERKTPDQKRKEQPSLSLETCYKDLFEFQPRMMRMGDLDKPYTQEEIDGDVKIMEHIQEYFQRCQQWMFIYKIFTHYKAQFLPKGFVELCFLKIDWYPKFRKIINIRCCYEVEDPVYGPVLVLIPRMERFDNLVEDCVVQIFKEQGLIEKIPIKSSVIQDFYQLDLMVKDIYLPHLKYYPARKKLRLDDIFQALQENERFIKKLATAMNMNEEDIKGKQIFEHEKGENIRQRSDIIETYKIKEVLSGKSELCRFFVRGLCIFDAKECKFAHGIEDLDFKRVDIESHEKKNVEQKKDQDYKEWEKNWVDVLKERQPSLNLEFSYKNLYNYQFKEVNPEIVRVPSEQVDKDDPKWKDIQVYQTYMHTDIARQFVNFLLKFYERKYLARSFIDKCFQSIGWVTNWAMILDGDFCYEVKHPSLGFVIRRISPPEELEAFMRECVIKIIKDNSLIEKLPVSAGAVSKYFYKDLVPADPFMPTLQVYLKRTQKSLDDFLLELQADKDFKLKLIRECNKVVEINVEEVVVFDSSTTELNSLMLKIKKILQDMIDKSHIGFILFSRLEEAVHKKCTKEVTQFSNNQGFLKKIVRGIAMSSGVLIISSLSDVCLFSPRKFKSVDIQAIGKKYEQKLNMKCKKKEVKHTQASQNPLVVNAAEEQGEEKISEENLDKEIDLEKIIVVDTEESLEKAKQVISNTEIIAIDLEGILNKGGMIDLIQFGCGELIFIFDVYKVSSTETLHKVRDNMISYIKEVMENPKICKIFHDCRKDSLALHLFANSCPVNVFDVSAVHTLIEHLEIYSNFKNLLSLSQDEECKSNDNEQPNLKERFEKGLEILSYVDGIKPSGLNEILKTYHASHGVNHLKLVMKKKFEEMPREYFLKRPLDKEYLIYAAKDVEDLVEVKRNIEMRLGQTLGKISGTEDKELVRFLWKKVSKRYVLFGCMNSS